MLISQMIKKIKCSDSTLNRLARLGKIQSELIINKKTGRRARNILTPIAEVSEIIKKEMPKSGYKKNGTTLNSKSSFLSQIVEWRAVPDAKRKILITFSEHSLAELRILLELIK